MLAASRHLQCVDVPTVERVERIERAASGCYYSGTRDCGRSVAVAIMNAGADSPEPGNGLRRRDVLRGAAALALGAAVGSLGCAPKKRSRMGTVLGTGRFLDKDTGQTTYLLALFDLDQSRTRTVPMAFFGHGFAPDPKSLPRGVIFEKKGRGCCEVDLAAGRVVRPIETASNRAFYGHGAFSRDGQLLFATENQLDTKDGLIAVRDGRTLKELGQFPTYGKSPHDCHLIDAGRTLAITNGGGTFADPSPEAAPSVTFVEVASAKLLEKLTFETPRINAGHLALSARRDLVAISAPRDGLPTSDPGGITVRSGGSSFATLTEPRDVMARMVGETLSLCIDERSSVVAATNPDGNLVTFWDLISRRYVKHLDLPAPRGLTRTLDGEYFVLSYGRESGILTLVSPATLEPVPLHRVDRAPVSGSHLFTWDEAPAQA